MPGSRGPEARGMSGLPYVTWTTGTGTAGADPLPDSAVYTTTVQMMFHLAGPGVHGKSAFGRRYAGENPHCRPEVWW